MLVLVFSSKHCCVQPHTFSLSSSLIVKHQGHSTLHFWLFWTFCNKVVWPICGGCWCLFPQHAVLICLLHVWVPLRFSGSVLSSVSLSSLHPHHAYFHLARPPPLQSPCSHGFTDASWCIILLGYCVARLAQNSATVASVQSVYFCNLLNWGNKGMRSCLSKYFPDSLGCSWFCNGSFL